MRIAAGQILEFQADDPILDQWVIRRGIGAAFQGFAINRHNGINERPEEILKGL